MKQSKKVLVLATLACLVLLLGACGKAKKESKESSDTLTVMFESDPTKSNPEFYLALKAWAEETDHKIKELVIPYDDQLTKFPQMVKNNDAPDLVATTRLNRQFSDDFMDLSKVIDIENFDQNALKLIGYPNKENKDKLTGIPYNYTITMYIYNKEAFEQAGITVPTSDSPWTLDELYKNAEILQQKGGVKYGLAVDYSTNRYDNLIYSNGGSVAKEVNNEVHVKVNSKENISTLEKFVELNESGVIPKVVWTGGSAANPADYFTNGDLGIYLSGSWAYRDMLEKSKVEFGILPSPMGSAARSSLGGGGNLAIPELAANAELSQEFLKWFYEKENLQNYMNESKTVSFVEGINYNPEDEKTKADWEIINAEAKLIPEDYVFDTKSGYTDFAYIDYRDAIKKAVAGEQTPKEALDDFAKLLSEKMDWKLEK